jgi:hypothetical protein
MKKLSEISGVVPAIDEVIIKDKFGNNIAVLYWDFFKRINVKYASRESQLEKKATPKIKKMFGKDIIIEFKFGEFDVS